MARRRRSACSHLRAPWHCLKQFSSAVRCEGPRHLCRVPVLGLNNRLSRLSFLHAAQPTGHACTKGAIPCAAACPWQQQAALPPPAPAAPRLALVHPPLPHPAAGAALYASELTLLHGVTGAD